MGHYAYIDSENVVVEVITGRDENETVDGISDWETYYTTQRDNLRAVRTSYNTSGGVHYDPHTGEPSADQSKALRMNYAGIGYTYDADRDAFIPPKPYNSWVLNEDTCLWEAPVPMPEDENMYTWDEENQEWAVIENATN